MADEMNSIVDTGNAGNTGNEVPIEEGNITPENIDNTEGIADTAEPITEVVEDPQGQPKPQVKSDAWDYKKDKRWGKIWKSEADIIKSYRELDTKYPKVKTEYETLMKTLREHELDPTKISDYVKSYRDATDPNRYENQVSEYLIKYLNNPVYGNQIVDFFKAIEKQEMQAKWGEQLPDRVIQQLEEFEAYKTEQERKNQEVQYKQEFDTHVSTLESQDKLNEEYAKKYGIDYDEKTRQDLFTYCKNSGIDPKYVHLEFRKFCEEAIDKQREIIAEERVLKRLQTQKKAGVIQTNTPKPVNTEKANFREEMRQRIFGSKNKS